MTSKVLRIIARLNIGGPARNAVLLTEGFSNTVLVCGEVNENEGNMSYLAKEKGIEPIIVPELSRELSFINDWRALWKIYRIICKEKPDIIHTHTAKAGTLGRLSGILYNVTHFSFKLKADSCKLVHTFHGHILHSYFGTVKTFFFICIEKILALFTDKIIAVSASLKKELIERFRIAPKKKFSVIELGFELDELLKMPLKQNFDCINIGIVGRLTAIKNHKMLFRVANCLNKKMGQSQKNGTVPIFCLKFIIIGDGELREVLQDYARELNIEDRIEFKGWVRDLCSIYKELDIVVLTSLNEGTPVSIIEAMAAGRPVVATEVGGVSDIIEDGKSGYLIASNDEENFAGKLQDLISDSSKRERFGVYAREIVKNRFSKERLINDIDKLYNTLLDFRK